MSHRLPLADIKFIADFAAFARSKGDEAYDYCKPATCAMAQFYDATGNNCHSDIVYQHSGNYFDFTTDGGLPRALSARPQTFAALAERLDALLVDAPAVQS